MIFLEPGEVGWGQAVRGVAPYSTAFVAFIKQ